MCVHNYFDNLCVQNDSTYRGSKAVIHRNVSSIFCLIFVGTSISK